MEEKIITFTITGPGGSVTGEDPKTLIEMLFGVGDYPHVSCPTTIQDCFGDLNPSEIVEYTLKVEKRFTREELESFPESDGDIN